MLWNNTDDFGRGISSGSKLQRGEGRVLRPETIKRLEEASRVVNANNILVRNSLAPEFGDKCLEQPIVLSSDSRSRSYGSQEEMIGEFSTLKLGSNQDASTAEKSMSATKELFPTKTTTHDRANLTGPTRLPPTARGLMATRSKPGEHTSPIHKISSTQKSIIPNPLPPQKEISGFQAAFKNPTGHYQPNELTGVDNQFCPAANSVIGESSRSLPGTRGVPAVEEATIQQYETQQYKSSLGDPSSPEIPAVDNSFFEMTKFMAGETMMDRSRKLASLSAAMGIPPPPLNPRIALMALPQSTIEPASFAFKKSSPGLKSLPSVDSFKSAVSVQNEDSELKNKLEEVVEEILHAFQTAIDVFKNTVDEKAPRSWQFETATNLLKSRLQDGKATINSKYAWYLKADESRYVFDFKAVDINELERIPPMLMTGIVVELHMHSTKPDSFREVLFKRLYSVSEDCRVKASFQLEKIQRTSLFPDLDLKRVREYFPPMPMPIGAEHSSISIPPKEQKELGMLPTLTELFPHGLPEEGNLCSTTKQPKNEIAVAGSHTSSEILQPDTGEELSIKNRTGLRGRTSKKSDYGKYPNHVKTSPDASSSASVEPQKPQGELINLISVKKPKHREANPITSPVPCPVPMSFVDHKASAGATSADLYGLENIPNRAIPNPGSKAEHVFADSSSSIKTVSGGLSNRRNRPKYIPQTPRKPELKHSDVSRPLPLTYSQVAESATQDSKAETQESPISTSVGEKVFGQFMGLGPLDSFDTPLYPWGGEEKPEVLGIDDAEIGSCEYDYVQLTKDEDESNTKGKEPARKPQDLEATKNEPRKEERRQNQGDSEESYCPTDLDKRDASPVPPLPRELYLFAGESQFRLVSEKGITGISSFSSASGWPEIEDSRERRSIENQIARRKYSRSSLISLVEKSIYTASKIILQSPWVRRKNFRTF